MYKITRLEIRGLCSSRLEVECLSTMYKLLGLSSAQFKKRTYLLLDMVLPSSETERQCTPEGLSRQALYIVQAVPELTM